MSHSVIVKTLSDILEDVDSINDDAFSSLKKKLFWMEEGFSHSLNLLIVMVINLSAMIKHVANIRYCKSHLVNSFGYFLIRAIPESSHGIF